MIETSPLSADLLASYRGWKATAGEENRAGFRRLADIGQSPRAMVVSCCDSRGHVTAIFAADQDAFFIHRNIANLVPPHAPDGTCHATSAAIEFAVPSLRVANLVVLGHSGCGGVKGCHDMCSGKAPQLDQGASYPGRWMDLLRPGYRRVAGIADESRQIRALEKEAVPISLENLVTFPFVRRAVEDELLMLHGLRIDIGTGGLEQFSPEKGGSCPSDPAGPVPFSFFLPAGKTTRNP